MMTVPVGSVITMTVTGEFPAQRPVARKMVPFDDVIMAA